MALTLDPSCFLNRMSSLLGCDDSVGLSHPCFLDMEVFDAPLFIFNCSASGANSAWAAEDEFSSSSVVANHWLASYCLSWSNAFVAIASLASLLAFLLVFDFEWVTC